MNSNLAFLIKETNEERLKNSDTYNLLTSDLLSVLISGNDPLSTSIKLLDQNYLPELAIMKYDQLKKYGLSDNSIIRIIAAFELSRRLETFQREPKPKMTSPEEVYRKTYPYYRELKKEIFLVLLLDTKNQIIKQEVVSIGSLNANIVHPREVFKPALIASAAHIIVTHNHPSGDPTPSTEDLEITKKLCESGRFLGIDLLDHVIIGEGRHFSLKEAGHI